MSTVGDDDLPPWLLEDNSGVQVDAGDSTLIPAPDEPIADAGGKASTRQNQPNIAATDDVMVDTPTTPVGGVDPLSGAAVTPNAAAPVASQPSTPKPAVTSKPGKTAIAKSGGTKSGKGGKKAGKKLSKPTMVVYKVRKGDNLTDIAKRSHTTVAQIRKDSGIKGDLIHPGQIIKVRYTPKGYKPGTKTSKGGNNKKATKPTRGKGYTVRKGETISGIAKKNGVSTAALLKANNMKASDAVKMRAGQKLVIPKN